MQIIKYPLIDKWEQLCQRPVFEKEDLDTKVKEIFTNVKKSKDEALLSYTKKFDGADLITLQVTEQEIGSAKSSISTELKNAINIAKNNIEKFHESQIENAEKIETTTGVTCWRESRPIEKVGIYIPAGTAPLFSTILMLAIPASIAGCKEIILCSPANKDGQINEAILYTANLLGITKIFKVGGAQAIAAFTFGTETIPAVYKIFGPGNQYVTAAKQLALNYGVAIDMPAGPSEVLVIADENADADFVAADLLSQAEHGADSQVILLGNNEDKISEIIKAIETQVKQLPRAETALKALANSKAIILKDLNTCIDFSNQYAPEHLIIQTENVESYITKIVNAGSVFLGKYSCESLGDYASGTNHTLPTNGFAKNYSGVSVDSFVKKITFQEVSETGIKNISNAVETMAAAEGLQAHKNAVTIRLKKL
jgi:histidinol dehydrogenase